MRSTISALNGGHRIGYAITLCTTLGLCNMQDRKLLMLCRCSLLGGGSDIV